MFHDRSTVDESPLLKIEDLSIHFKTHRGVLRAVRNLNLEIRPGEIFGLVGESGCGKSITARTILGLLPVPPASIESGAVHFHEQNLLNISDEKLRRIRGREISMIFQEPMTSLNPVYKIGRQVSEAAIIQQSISRSEAKKLVLETFRSVGLPEPERRYNQYPHELSGGLRQRVMIAMALVSDVSLLIADEPTTALDVTIQAQILDLMASANKERGMSVLMITHDLGVIAQLAHRVAVMYAGKIVEQAPVTQLLNEPRHPYTQALLASIPSVDALHTRDARLETISGTVPELYDIPKGCPFADRCSQCADECWNRDPQLTGCGNDHWAACRLVE